MPQNTPDELTQKIESILREAGEQIVAAVEANQAAFIDSLKQAVSAMDPSLAPAPAPGRPSSTRRPPRDQWVKTADVIARLQEVLKRRRKGLLIGELREETGYSDMQLHRALNQLMDSGDVVRSGERRHTVYQLTPRQTGKKSTRKKKSSRRTSRR